MKIVETDYGGMNDMEDYLRVLAETVSREREAQGLTQDNLAELAGLVGKSVSNMERGEVSPNYQSVYHVLRCLSIDANEVVYPEHGGDNSLRSQIQRLLAGCSDSELEMLLAVNRDILKHIRLRDEIRKTTTV